MKTIKNPILPGFHPDPSICRVGDDYYIATSTFEWFPGVRLHHSRDLINWRFIGYILTRESQLNMIGNVDGGGVWAPCLTYDNGTFYCIFSDAKDFCNPYDNIHNYVVTASDINGPWSEPSYLNSSGFDPSLFHDDDGKKWYVNMVWDHRTGKHPFYGIDLQEYSEEERKLVGPIKNIFKGSVLQLTEAPHLYKKDGFYYLVTAEGGTGNNHAVTVARSKNVDGPYEIHPENPILTSRYDPTLPLQRAGHASIVQTQDGEWYMPYLCGRPIMPEGRCILGRETSIQKLVWEKGKWPKLTTGGNTPTLEVEAPNLSEQPFEVNSKNSYKKDDFDSDTLDPEFNSLRVPVDASWCSLSDRPGHLRLYGRESLHSRHRQSLIARRIISLKTVVSTVLEFKPDSFQQMAGLVFYYDTRNHHYLYLTQSEKGRCLNLMTCDSGNRHEHPEAEIYVDVDKVYLKGEMNSRELQFYYATEQDKWKPIGRMVDASILSDEYDTIIGKFTGAFAGICVQDISGRRLAADFDWFNIEELK